MFIYVDNANAQKQTNFARIFLVKKRDTQDQDRDITVDLIIKHGLVRLT